MNEYFSPRWDLTIELFVFKANKLLVIMSFVFITLSKHLSDEKLAANYEKIDFVGKSVPFFILCVVLEFIFAPITGTRIRLNDVLGSLTAGSYSRISELFGISQAMLIYYPFYQYCRFFDLPYHAWWHWILAGFAVDFGYYWAHR